MNSYCLDKNELDAFLMSLLYNEVVEDTHLAAVISDCKEWIMQSKGLTYFLGQILQRKINGGLIVDDFIDRVYQLEHDVYFEINDLETDFIQYILLHDRLIESKYSLEEILNLLHANYTDKYYGRIVRY